MGPNQIRDGAYNEQQKDSANPACICLRTPVANTLPRPVLRHDQSIIGVDRIRRTLAQGASIDGPRGNMGGDALRPFGAAVSGPAIHPLKHSVELVVNGVASE